MPSLINDFPTEVRKAVLLKQADLKFEKKNRFKTSQKDTIVQIVKEWMEFKKLKQSA